MKKIYLVLQGSLLEARLLTSLINRNGEITVCGNQYETRYDAYTTYRTIKDRGGEVVYLCVIVTDRISDEGHNEEIRTVEYLAGGHVFGIRRHLLDELRIPADCRTEETLAEYGAKHKSALEMEPIIKALRAYIDEYIDL